MKIIETVRNPDGSMTIRYDNGIEFTDYPAKLKSETHGGDASQEGKAELVTAAVEAEGRAEQETKGNKGDERSEADVSEGDQDDSEKGEGSPAEGEGSEGEGRSEDETEDESQKGEPPVILRELPDRLRVRAFRTKRAVKAGGPECPYDHVAYEVWEPHDQEWREYANMKLEKFNHLALDQSAFRFGI